MKSVDSFTAYHLLYVITVLYISALFYVQLHFVNWSKYINRLLFYCA